VITSLLLEKTTRPDIERVNSLKLGALNELRRASNDVKLVSKHTYIRVCVGRKSFQYLISHLVCPAVRGCHIYILFMREDVRGHLLRQCVLPHNLLNRGRQRHKIIKQTHNNHRLGALIKSKSAFLNAPYAMGERNLPRSILLYVLADMSWCNSRRPQDHFHEWIGQERGELRPHYVDLLGRSAPIISTLRLYTPPLSVCPDKFFVVSLRRMQLTHLSSYYRTFPHRLTSILFEKYIKMILFVLHWGKRESGGNGEG
jgi:hypothetical protein